MAAEFQFYQTYGPGGGVDVPQGTGGGSNDWDFKDVDSPGPGSAATAITAGDFSYQVYVRGKFAHPAGGPNFSAITNIRYYASNLDLTGYGTGAYVLGSGLTAYPGGSNASMSGTWDPIPTVGVSGIDVSTANLGAGTEGYTNWVGLQLKTTTTSPVPGAGGLITWTLQYDEV